MSKGSSPLPDNTDLLSLGFWNSFFWEESSQFFCLMREKNEINEGKVAAELNVM